MSVPIAHLRDDFADNLQAATWGDSLVIGSATKAETGGQAVLTLPSSTAGSHAALYSSSANYNLTGDGFYFTIGTMVATGVAAQANFDLFLDASNILRWRQLSNAITARTIVAGVDTQLFTATWSSSTYKYLRIRESGGTVFFDSSTNGTSWTNRASVANPFAVTALYVQFSASCGNVASPGSLRLDDVNLILPALSSTWHWTQVEWPLLNRFAVITLASTTNAQGYIATSSDGTTWAYYSGPLGSTSGGYASLTLQSSQAAAQAMAVSLPSSNEPRWDLPTQVECRFIRLYHRSTTGANYRIDEYYPRRLVQADDIEAESIKAINIAAGAVTADKIFVLNLAAVSAQMGALHMDGVIDIATTGGIYQGTGTFASPTTGLKLFNSGGVGKLSTYNTAVEQVTFDTDGKLKAGAGSVALDAAGVRLVGADVAASRIKWYDAAAGGDFSTVVGGYGSNVTGLYLRCDGPDVAHPNAASIVLLSRNYVGSTRALAVVDGLNAVFRVETGGFYVGSSTSPTVTSGAAQIDGSVGIGIAAQSNVRLYVKSISTTSSNYAFILADSANATLLSVRDDNVFFIDAVAWTYSSDARLKEGIVPLDRGMADLLKLKPVAFDYTKGAKNEWGFLAQDVQAVMPELVSENEKGYLGMKTTSLIPVLVNALQEVNKRLKKAGL